MSSAASFDEIGQECPFDALVQALRAGDEAVWTRVFDQLLPRVSAAIRREFGTEIARPENAGGQAVASAARTIYRHLKAGKFELKDWNDLAGLFIRIAMNKCVERLKQEQRAVNWSDLAAGRDAEDGNGPLEPAAAGGSPMDAVIRAEAWQEFKRVVDLVQRRLKRVNAKYSAIFRLRLEGNYSTKQIGALVHCSEATVKRGWAYAVRLLREMLDESIVKDLTR